MWDIVGEFGVAGEHINAGHNLNMPPNVQHCYHAMALDECRAFFQLTRLTGTGVNEAGRLVEVWFRGVHSDIGGGNGNFGLNWIALNWMYENARRHNLKISPAKIADNLKRKIDNPHHQGAQGGGRARAKDSHRRPAALQRAARPDHRQASAQRPEVSVGADR